MVKQGSSKAYQQSSGTGISLKTKQKYIHLSKYALKTHLIVINNKIQICKTKVK